MHALSLETANQEGKGIFLQKKILPVSRNS